MPMFESDEEFEAYVAKQQQELAGDAAEQQPAAAPKPPGAMEQCNKALALVIPVALFAIIGFFVWRNTPDPRSVSNDPWDNLLGGAAWATGREYNADANTLTERLTLRKPGDTRGEKD